MSDNWSHEETDDPGFAAGVTSTKFGGAHAFRISSACVSARFDLDHIFAEVVHPSFSEPAWQRYRRNLIRRSAAQIAKCVWFNFRCAATDIAATLAASMALPADADHDACEAPAA